MHVLKQSTCTVHNFCWYIISTWCRFHWNTFSTWWCRLCWYVFSACHKFSLSSTGLRVCSSVIWTSMWVVHSLVPNYSTVWVWSCTHTKQQTSPQRWWEIVNKTCLWISPVHMGFLFKEHWLQRPVDVCQIWRDNSCCNWFLSVQSATYIDDCHSYMYTNKLVKR